MEKFNEWVKWPGIFKESKKRLNEEEIDKKFQDDIQLFVDSKLQCIVYAFCYLKQTSIYVSLELAGEKYVNKDKSLIVLNDDFQKELQKFLDKKYPNKYTCRVVDASIVYSKGYSFGIQPK